MGKQLLGDEALRLDFIIALARFHPESSGPMIGQDAEPLLGVSGTLGVYVVAVHFDYESSSIRDNYEIRLNSVVLLATAKEDGERCECEPRTLQRSLYVL